MTNISVDASTHNLECLVATYVNELESLPGVGRLNEASQNAIYGMACALLQSGQLPLASAYFSFLLLYAPTHTDYLRGQAHCAMLDADAARAVELLSLALYIKPESSAIALELAESLISAKAPVTARNILLMVRKLAVLPTDIIEHTRAGLLLQGLPADQDMHAAT